MMTTPDYSTSSHDEALRQTSEVIADMQRPPIQPPPPPKMNAVGCLINSGYGQSPQKTGCVSMYKQDSFDESHYRQSRLGVHTTMAILAFAMGIGIYWSIENLGRRVGPPSDSEFGTTVDKKDAANTPDSEMNAENSRQDPKAATAKHLSAQTVVTLPEKRSMESQPVRATATSDIGQIADRVVRLDDEFSRLKVDIADWKNAEELRRQTAIKNTAWTKAISAGQLVIRTNVDERIKSNLPLVFVPAGQFWMGQTTAQRGESARASSAAHYDFSHPAYPVQIKLGYFIGMYEVTFGQIQEFAAQNDAVGAVMASLRNQHETDLNKPVCNIDWNTAVAFCDWLSKINNIEVRLPTEVEWEYAARGNSYVQSFESIRERDLVMGGPWPVDNQTLDRSWCGCVAMNSNVQEWTIDLWDEKAYGRRDAALKSSRTNSCFLYAGPESNAIHSSIEPRAVRGSSFQDIPANRVLAIRRFKPVNAREETLGFRVVVPIFTEESTGK